MKLRKPLDAFNLAFLDVMACGLGAVLLILIVVKFNASSIDPTDEIKRLQEELAASESEQANIKKSIAELNDKIALESSLIEATEKHNEILQIEQTALNKAISNKKAVIANRENAIAAAAPKQAADPIDLSGSGEENYILGLKVEGRQIAILLDSSASMTEESLEKAMMLKFGSENERQSGAKWYRATRVAKWLLARTPKDSKVTLITYNESAKTLVRDVNTVTAKKSSIKRLAEAVNKVVPENGTNLYKALTLLNQVMPQVSDIYVITDGLPTMGASNCASGGLVSGECRVRIFRETVKAVTPSKAKVNVILLPLEGDPDAPNEYWIWAHNNYGGTLLTPARTWP